MTALILASYTEHFGKKKIEDALIVLDYEKHYLKLSLYRGTQGGTKPFSVLWLDRAQFMNSVYAQCVKEGYAKLEDLKKPLT